MLVLSRRVGESIIIDGCIAVKVLRADGDQIKIGIEAPSRVTVNRKEVQGRMEKPRLRGGLSTFSECQQPTVVIGLTE